MQRRRKHALVTKERLFSALSLQSGYKEEFFWEVVVESNRVSRLQPARILARDQRNRNESSHRNWQLQNKEGISL
jgi:hypothetical protein